MSGAAHGPAMDHPRIDEERVLDRYLAGRLSEDEEALFEEHLFECSACLEQAEAGEDLRRGLQAVAAEDAVRTTVAVGLLAWLRTRPAVYRGAFAALALALILLPIVLVWQQIALRDARQAAEEAARRAQQQGPPEAPGFTAPLAAFQVISLGVVRDSTADPMTIQPDPQLPRHPPH